MIELKITVQTPGELADHVKELAAQYQVQLFKREYDCELPKKEEPKHETTFLAEEIKEEPKKERVKKEKKAEAPKEEPKAETTPAPSEYTKQDVADACQKVSTAKSLVAAKEILSKFNSADGSPCKRISDLQVSEYGAFIAKCNEAI